MKLGGFVFFPRLYKLSSQRRHSSYAARFSARGDCLVFPDRTNQRETYARVGRAAADLPLLRLFSQIVNSFEARYTDDQTSNGLMRMFLCRLRSVA